MNKLCECGCGQEIIIKPHHKYYGIPHFINSHHHKGKNHPMFKMEFCSMRKCNEKHYSKGLCKKHYDKARRKNNKEQRAIQIKQWRKNNKEHVIKYRKEYNQTSAGKLSTKAHHHNRRILTRGLTIAIVQSVYEDNIKKFGRLTCCLCFKPIEFGKDSLEHLTPLSRGGSNDYDNLGVAHRKCNNKKTTKTLDEWFKNRQISIGVSNESS